MSLSEIDRVFDEYRQELSPYGLTCERWRPNLMLKPDRHNEIELNLLKSGSITYLLRGKRVNIPPGRLTIFWALAPHQIVDTEGDDPYYVATIPLTQFLQWKFPAKFLNLILQGEVISECSDGYSEPDSFLFEQWLLDVNDTDVQRREIAMLEMQARLRRLALTSTENSETVELQALDHENQSKVEQMAVFVAANYRHSIQVKEIAEAVHLHPDYATVLFKKTFGITLSDYLAASRISHAQRMLVTTKTKVTEICYESGYNSVSRFNAAFKKSCGCTPRQYRNNHH